MTIKKKKISEFPLAESLKGFSTIGYQGAYKQTVRADLGFVEEAAEKANQAASNADAKAVKADAAMVNASKAWETVKDGLESITPIVGANENWIVAGQDTGKPSRGTKGDKGDTGLQGETGVQGPQGLKGDKGDTGVQGPQGLKGDKGDTGAQGSQGLKGDKGDTGAQGPQGLKGDKGDTGAQGSQGLKGDKGDTGAQGPQGLKGDKGDTGAQGPQGLKGDKGDTGAQGPQGLKGDKGDTGAQGPQGLKGDKGDTGASFTYSDFTSEQIDNIKRPAIEAAAAANQARNAIANDLAKKQDKITAGTGIRIDENIISLNARTECMILPEIELRVTQSKYGVSKLFPNEGNRYNCYLEFRINATDDQIRSLTENGCCIALFRYNRRNKTSKQEKHKLWHIVECRPNPKGLHYPAVRNFPVELKDNSSVYWTSGYGIMPIPLDEIINADWIDLRKWHRFPLSMEHIMRRFVYLEQRVDRASTVTILPMSCYNSSYVPQDNLKSTTVTMHISGTRNCQTIYGKREFSQGATSGNMMLKQQSFVSINLGLGLAFKEGLNSRLERWNKGGVQRFIGLLRKRRGYPQYTVKLTSGKAPNVKAN